ncbi:hypothetical protein FQR65_LT21016 [Abscondita terminalis]|nr:hypothetical protein FQR65_LT21016 [Abscondita terminalis]
MPLLVCKTRKFQKAAFTGTVGYKPPYGRVPAHGPVGIDTFRSDGPLARTVDDAILFTNVVAGLRIALSIDLGMFTVDREVEQHTRAVASALEDAGAEVVEVQLPWDRATLGAAAAIHFAQIMAPMVAGRVAGNEQLLSGDALSGFDALLCPTTGALGFPAGDDLSAGIQINGETITGSEGLLTIPFNICNRVPVLAVPSGVAQNGMPTGCRSLGMRLPRRLCSGSAKPGAKCANASASQLSRVTIQYSGGMQQRSGEEREKFPPRRVDMCRESQTGCAASKSASASRGRNRVGRRGTGRRGTGTNEQPCGGAARDHRWPVSSVRTGLDDLGPVLLRRERGGRSWQRIGRRRAPADRVLGRAARTCALVSHRGHAHAAQFPQARACTRDRPDPHISAADGVCERGSTVRAGRIAAWVAGVLLTGLYAYAIAAAVGNLIGMSTFLGDTFGVLPWVMLGAGIAVPALAFIVALLIGRGRGPGVRILILATGLCVAAAIQLEIMHLIS